MSNKNMRQQQKQFKVSIITQFYPPDYAATGQLIEELATQLGRLGLPVQVFTGQPGYAFQKQSAPAVERSNKVLVQRSRAARLWPQRIRGKTINGLLFCLRSGLHLLKISGRGDILLVTTAPPFLQILGYLANVCFGLPYVCLLYDLYPDIAVELNVVPATHRLVRLWDALNNRIWRNSKAIIVLSPSMKQRLVAKCPEVAHKIAVIHNWANPDWIAPIPKQDNWFAQEFNLVDTFTVLYSGNMGRCHDMETILEAAKLLNDEPIQFVFIGSGAKHQACINKVNLMGLTNCRFLPYQSKQNLPYSLTACDLSLVSVCPGMEGLVVPSKFYAALAAARPIAVICEKQSYLRQLLKDANCGAAFCNGNGDGLAKFIRRLSRSPQLVEQMGNSGRRYLEANFTPEIIAKQYSDVLCQAMLDPLEPPCSVVIDKTTGQTLPLHQKNQKKTVRVSKHPQD